MRWIALPQRRWKTTPPSPSVQLYACSLTLSNVWKCQRLFIWKKQLFNFRIDPIITMKWVYFIVRCFISQENTNKVLHAFTSSRLQHCNGLFSGLEEITIVYLQLIQNAAVRVFHKIQKEWTYFPCSQINALSTNKLQNGFYNYFIGLQIS